MTRTLTRVGGYWPAIVLVAALGVMFSGVLVGFLAPSLREAPPFVTEDIGAAAAAIAGNPGAWQTANLLILDAGLITALGLVGLTMRFDSRGRTWARAGLVAYVMAAVFLAAERYIEVGVTTWAAELYPDPNVMVVWEAFDRFGDGFAGGFGVLTFLAIGFYGLAMWKESSGPGPAFIGLGGIGILAVVAGFAIPLWMFLGTAALGAASLKRRSPTG